MAGGRELSGEGRMGGLREGRREGGWELSREG